MLNRSMPNDHKIGNKWREGLRPANAFTSKQAKEMNSVERESFKCAHCGNSFEVIPWIVRQNKTKSGDRFCSKSCHSLFKAERESGPNSKQWVGGITTYRGKGWLEARMLAVERDKGTCQTCGKVIGKSIPVHHIIPFRMFESTAAANHIDNLVCLCQPCHMKMEKVAAYPLHAECAHT